MHPFPVAGEIELERVGQKPAERLGHVATRHFVVIDIEAIEDALVQIAAVRVRRVLVVPTGVGEQRAQVVQLLQDQFLVGRMLRDRRLSGGTGLGDAHLLLLHAIHRHGVCVVGLHESVELCLQFPQRPAGLVLFALLARHEGVDVGENEASNLSDSPFGQRDRAPVLLDQRLQDVRLRGLERAAVLEALASKAVEVVIEDPGAVTALLEGERFAALAAVERALEVVRMDARLLAALDAGLPHLLGTGEQFLADERRVLARVLDAFVLDWVIDAWVYGHIDDKDPLFEEFFGQMPPALRGKSLGSVAWSFFRAESADEVIVERFNALWDQRLPHVREVPEDSDELSGFFWLAKSAHHEASWWLPRLRDALELEPSIASERYMIGKEIALASVSDPRNALAVTKLLIGQQPSGMVAHDLSRHAIPTVITNAIRSGDDDLATESKAFMNELGAGGY